MEQDTGRSVEQADGLSDEELDEQHAAALPDREAMSTIGLDLTGIDNFAMPINEAVAINNQSVNSVAVADADQTVIIGQADTEARVMSQAEEGLTPEELATHDAAALPDREAMSTIPTSLLDLDVNVDAALDLAAPVNAGIAANANAALPIDAAVSANILSPGAESGARPSRSRSSTRSSTASRSPTPTRRRTSTRARRPLARHRHDGAAADTTAGTDTTTTGGA